MTTTEFLSNQVGSKLSNVQRVAPKVVRAERNGPSGDPYAIYYFALSEDLEDWAENLEQKQDEIIGPAYFESPGDLRWNHYLYLLVPHQQVQKDSFQGLKRQIEKDSTYARKFVLQQEDLPTALEQLEPTTKSSTDMPAVDILSVWTERLMKSHLGIVLDQLSPAETIRKISSGQNTRQPSKADLKRKRKAPQPMATGFLDAINLVQFRNWPKQHFFDQLGTVNLIVGTNGVGKTTFLESIEFAYCLENVRVSAPKDAHIKIRLKGSDAWHDSRAPGNTDTLKQRNLDWYGQRDLRGSTLAESFSRFNLLPTDEAAMLARPGADVSFKEMLSRLIGGSQTSQLWDHITRLRQPLTAERSKIRYDLSEAKKTRMSLETVIAMEESSPRASDSDFSALVEDLFRLDWKAQITPSSVTSDCVPALTRASSLARELASANLGLETVSARLILARRDSLAHSFEVSKKLMDIFNEADVSMKKNRIIIKGPLQERNQIASIESAFKLGAFDALEAVGNLSQKCADTRRIIGAVFPQQILSIVGDSTQSLEEEMKANHTRLQDAELAHARLTGELASTRKTEESVASLAAQLRTLTRHWLQVDPQHKDCPVCATQFEPGELSRRLEALDARMSSNAVVPLLEAVEAANRCRSREAEMRAALKQLSEYAVRRGLDSATMSALEVFRDQGSQRTALDELERNQTQASNRLSALYRHQLDDRRIAELHLIARSLGIDDITADALQRAHAETESKIAVLDAEFAETSRRAQELATEIRALFPWASDPTASVGETVMEARKNHSILQKAILLTEELCGLMDLDEDQDIVGLTALIDSAKEAAERFATALASEASSRSRLEEARARHVQTEAKIVEYEVIIKRLSDAMEQVTQLMETESLSDATDAELTQVQSATDTVFRRIHSPHEYGVRRHASAPLYRLDDPKREVTLRDVSTGQRAAFVLSIFLAMNAKLQAAPPVLLFDDPVAHIDDFNSLSFLDHLRDVALTDTRQIFYATADARLAGLFEHKFAFLGDKFRRFDLSR